MRKDMRKIMMLMGIFLYLSTLVTAAPQGRIAAREGNTVLVRDNETGHEYRAVILATGMTLPGHCRDLDNGFKPEVGSEIFVYNPDTQGIRHLREHTFKSGVVKEFMCGEHGTINGVSYDDMAFAFWYHPAPNTA